MRVASASRRSKCSGPRIPLRTSAIRASSASTAPSSSCSIEGTGCRDKGRSPESRNPPAQPPGTMGALGGFRGHQVRFGRSCGGVVLARSGDQMGGSILLRPGIGAKQAAKRDLPAGHYHDGRCNHWPDDLSGAGKPICPHALFVPPTLHPLRKRLAPASHDNLLCTATMSSSSTRSRAQP